MSIVNLYDSLSGSKTTGGTWAYVSGPGSAPTPPAAYNDNIDFTGFSYDEYVYSYTVVNGSCSHTQNVTITYNQSFFAINNSCDGAVSILYDNSVSNFLNNLSNAENCAAGIAAPTDSGEAEPSSWSAISSYTGDLWFKAKVRLDGSSDPEFKVTVSGTQYTNGIQTPMIAVYTGTCGALSLEDDQVGFGSQYVETDILTTSGAPDTFFIRVASEVAGSFTLTITGNLS
jgi:hypothetical protein